MTIENKKTKVKYSISQNDWETIKKRGHARLYNILSMEKIEHIDLPTDVENILNFDEPKKKKRKPKTK